MDDRIRCPKCGAENYRTDTNCMTCGAALMPAAAQAGATQPAAASAGQARPGRRAPRVRMTRPPRSFGAAPAVVKAVHLLLLVGVFGYLLTVVFAAAGIWQSGWPFADFGLYGLVVVVSAPIVVLLVLLDRGVTRGHLAAWIIILIATVMEVVGFAVGAVAAAMNVTRFPDVVVVLCAALAGMILYGWVQGDAREWFAAG